MQKKFGVEEIALFGSYARGEEKSGSDVSDF
ncbi:MAG: nucleotidyltransferase domain-containing protein [Bacteroidota bacterium]|nr:nucleotidyltransferase domain-containing protein [Bacteroidota bacterium]